MPQLSDRDITCARLIRRRGQGTQWYLDLIARQLTRMTTKQLQALAEEDLRTQQQQEHTDDNDAA